LASGASQINRLADDADRKRLVDLRQPEVPAADTDCGHLLAGPAQGTVTHVGSHTRVM
jgi:hypothetical protein